MGAVGIGQSFPERWHVDGTTAVCWSDVDRLSERKGYKHDLRAHTEISIRILINSHMRLPWGVAMADRPALRLPSELCRVSQAGHQAAHTLVARAWRISEYRSIQIRGLACFETFKFRGMPSRRGEFFLSGNLRVRLQSKRVDSLSGCNA